MFKFVVLNLDMITEDHKLWGQSTAPTNNESIFVYSLTVIKITLLDRSLNIIRLMQTTLLVQMFHFKTIVYVVALVNIKQIVCIATTLIMWEMLILPEKEGF